MNDALNSKIMVAARWEAETVFFIADFMRAGVPPSQANLDRLALACQRLSKVILELGGKVPVAL